MFLFYKSEIPPRDSLLPDPVQQPFYQPPYTLVIEMSGLLLHLERRFGNALRYKKRPGLEYFINQIKYPLFEVVLFTREPFHSGVPIAASLDPHESIQFKLFRESHTLMNNQYVKDLSCMNRDMSKIIMIDWDPNSYRLQPRNALHGLAKWTGDDTDNDLYYLAAFLKMVAASEVTDVRDLLDHFNKERNPLEAFVFSQIESNEQSEESQ